MPQKKYKAFLSYSHDDEAFGKWLHKQLERYKIPKKLYNDYPDLPKSLYPIFRDRYELNAGDDLGVEIPKALGDSEALIVVCSPNSANSKWVNQEIIDFKMMYGEERIFPIIIGGEPFVKESDKFEDSLECFPEALKYRVDGDGNLTGERTSILASSTIEKEDGRELAKLKLIAGVLGVPFGEFYRRDLNQKKIELEEKAEKERLERNKVIKIVSAFAVIMTILAIYAFMQRDIAKENGKKYLISKKNAEKETENAKINEKEAKKNQIISKSNELASLSSYYLNIDPVLSFRLAEEAWSFSDTMLSNQALIKSYYQGIFYKEGSKKKFFKKNQILLYGKYVYSEFGNNVLIYERDNSRINYSIKHSIKLNSNFKTIFSHDVDRRFVFISDRDENIFIDLGNNVIKRIEIDKNITKANFSREASYLSLITNKEVIVYSEYGIKKISMPNENNITNFIVSDSIMSPIVKTT